MVGRDHVVQDRQAISLPGLIQPLQVTVPVPCELEEEFSLMAPMGDMPDEAWNVMPLCSRHRLAAITPFLPSKDEL